MKQKLYLLLCLLALGAGAGRLRAQIATVELVQSGATLNLQSLRGVPISGVTNTPPGSDGQQPAPSQNASGSGLGATTNQFRALISFGGVTAPTNQIRLTNSPALQAGNQTFSAAVAAAMQLPIVQDKGGVYMVLRRAQVGSPYLGQLVSFNFGSIIPMPSTDEHGVLLNSSNTLSAYWQGKPYNASTQTNSYYYSPNAGVVFASVPGFITITWVTASSYPANFSTNWFNYTNLLGTVGNTVIAPSFYTNGSQTYRLYTANYYVSPTPAKPPQQMYWTESSFQLLGYPVSLPPGRVSAIHVAYYGGFPATVTNVYQDPNSSPGVGQTNTENRTLWLNTGVSPNQIHAFNIQGLVFVELLGQPVAGGGNSQYLGNEIVNVVQAATPQPVSINLGEVLTPYQDGWEGVTPTPAPIQNNLGTQYYYSQVAAGGTTLYADQLTTDQNDLQVYWLTTGVAGLEWPDRFVNYSLVWPADPAAYSHYLRPPAATQAAAATTAVTLDGTESPSLDYQDPLDMNRAFLTSSNTFYTWLTVAEPAQRALLRFNAGGNVRFERVFSWLADGVETNSLLAGSVATNLTGWTTNNGGTLSYPNLFAVPYVTNMVVEVGDRIDAPTNELGNTGDYWAGWINPTVGNSYNPGIYLDPFANGFNLANQSSIIPVNAIPGNNQLEVWWFRQNNANAAQGFQPVYWPAVIGHYTIQWPTDAKQIILAGNQGSGTLQGAEGESKIYYQNDPTQTGYNPNEEHALMLGSTVYALRDDLNVTNGANPNLPFNGYSSAPFVLLEYIDDDGRPSMDTFLVRRDAPELGVFFDYVSPAGTKLQAPMPLPFMSAPVAPSTNYLSGITNYDSEPTAAGGDLPPGWQPAMATNTPYGNYPSFTFQDRQNSFWIYRGPHAGLPAFQAGDYIATNNTFTNLPTATAVAGSNFVYYINVSRPLESLGFTNVGALPAGLSLVETNSSIAIIGQPTATVATTNATTLEIFDNGDINGAGQPNTLNLALTIVVGTNGTPNAVPFALGPLVVSGTNRYSGEVETYTNLPPALSLAPTPANSFTMRFYYKTLPGFAWPGLGTVTNWPAVGSIVPYLRPFVNGVPVGDPTSSNTPSLDIVYRPIWPELQADGTPLPTLELGQTLTVPHGLAAIRGQDSAQVLYQQSIATNITVAPASVVLYDPTVEKKSSLTQYLNYNFTGADGLPNSVLADSYQGLLYFPNLPPNLASRFWFDPNTTNLVLEGQFVDLGDPAKDYLLPNILSQADLAALDGLCTTADKNYAAWTNAVANLAANVYTFSPNPLIPGSYQINPHLTTNYTAGQVVAINSPDSAVDSYAMCATGPGEGYISYLVGNSGNPKYASDPVLLYIARVKPPLYPGYCAVVNQANASPLSQQISFQHSSDLAGDLSDYVFDWEITAPLNNGNPNTNGWMPAPNNTGGPQYTLGSTGVQGLSDNYIEVRYRCTNSLADPAATNWSAYTAPTFAPGWITRVLDAVNPFQQRTTDLFNNPVDTTASLISQAGAAWDGNIPLNEAALTNSGLIQIYQTVLDVGKSLTIEASPPNGYGPACNALLEAAGSISDLYMVIGNDAWANSLNPTIGFGTTDTTYGAIATSQFVFEGQEPSLLEQNLALLRGRNDTIPEPGVNQFPVFNRLFWNYTFGIDAGEVIYALNYNITDQNGDGLVNAADAAIMYPQGHGDAYGHYLTAMTSYYELLMNTNFSWVPFSSPVTLAGSADTVLVNYEYERKFATAAAAVMRAGRQVFDLTWREDYESGTANGWDYFATNYFGGNTWTDTQNQKHDLTGYWGMDHWAARVGQGGYLNWVVVNSLLPPVDTNPNDQGIQKVDRTTVPELSELPQMASALENDMDNANAGFTPLGLSQNSIPFDINPQQVTGANPQTHFEQIYARAVQALNNAVVAFDDAQNVTQEMRQEQNSLDTYQQAVTAQELAFNNQLIAIYGTPYPNDIGPGQTYPQGYTGPDLVHYAYVDDPDTNTFGGILPDPTQASTNYLYIGNLPSDWATTMYENFDFYTNSLTENYNENTNYIPFVIGGDGFTKPPGWTSERVTPGSIQTAISTLVAAQDKLRQAVANTASDKQALDKAVAAFNAQTGNNQSILTDQNGIQGAQFTVNAVQNAQAVASQVFVQLNNTVSQAQTILEYSTPSIVIAGVADGGDELKLAFFPAFLATFAAQDAAQTANIVATTAAEVAITAAQAAALGLSVDMDNNAYQVNQENAVLALGQQLSTLQGDFTTINQDQRALSDAQTAYQQQVAAGNAIQQQRLTFRQQEAAVVSGYSTRNAAFLVFQNEKLTRYTSLFNLAAQYAYMAANAYDYETGLLDTPAGQAFLNQIISSSALGVVENGQPQISGTDTGDPGLANALAEMDADWSVLKGRLGFNNPDGYGTTVSLRTENYRINPDSSGDNNWQQVLQAGLMPDLTADTDVRQHCLQLGDGSGAAVPGIELTFGTTITQGENLFGQPLGPGDHDFSSSSFATKIFSVGVDLDGYVGMDNPVANSGSGGTSPPDPTLDPNALAATPYVYLIPVGADTMRSPPLGDTSTIRTWNINDVAIPLPFNISESDFSTTPFYTAANSLTEPLFAVRKQEAFRPVSTLSAFSPSIYGATGSLQPSQYSNERLIGRSVWNTKWKLIIPGYTLLANPNQGLSRFINSVKDIHLYFITYSYSGN